MAEVEIIQSKKTALLFGATGMVGHELMHQLLQHPAYQRVIAPGRRSMKLNHPKLDAPVVDFEQLELYLDRLKANDVYIALGTTNKKAGSQEAYRKVDYEYILRAARIAKAGSATQCLLVSSAGADPDSRFFYTRLKGETEAALRELDFWSTHIFRPGTLVGKRAEFRLGERVAVGVSNFLHRISPDILGKYNATRADVLARKMVMAAQRVEAGVHFYDAVDLLGKQ